MMSIDDDGPVGFCGGGPGTRVTATSSNFGPIRMIHVPDDEIVLSPNAPVIRLSDPASDV